MIQNIYDGQTFVILDLFQYHGHCQGGVKEPVRMRCHCQSSCPSIDQPPNFMFAFASQVNSKLWDIERPIKSDCSSISNTQKFNPCGSCEMPPLSDLQDIKANVSFGIHQPMYSVKQLSDTTAAIFVSVCPYLRDFIMKWLLI